MGDCDLWLEGKPAAEQTLVVGSPLFFFVSGNSESFQDQFSSWVRLSLWKHLYVFCGSGGEEIIPTKSVDGVLCLWIMQGLNQESQSLGNKTGKLVSLLSFFLLTL